MAETISMVSTSQPCQYILTRAAASTLLDHSVSRTHANQTRGCTGIGISDKILGGKRNLHEDQLLHPEHVHTLIDLPTSRTIEEVVQLFKGSSSHWVNENHLIGGRFSWGRGHGAFSVSHSDVGRVGAYIARQEEHHRKKSFAQEFELFVKRYGLEWRED